MNCFNKTVSKNLLLIRSLKFEDMRYSWIVLLLFIVCASCRTGKDNRQFRLVHKELPVAGMIIGSPVEMACIGNDLIIVDRKSDGFFHWIKLPDFRYMGLFGMRGQGPDEFLKVRSLHTFNDTLYCYDSHKSELFQVIPDEESGKLLFRSCHTFPESMTMDVFPLAKGVYCAYGCFDRGMFHLTDTLGSILYVTSDYPARDKSESQLSNQVRFMAYQGIIGTDGSGRMVYLTAQSKQRYAYSLRNDSLAATAIWQESFPQYAPDEGGGLSVVYESDSPLGYQDVAADQEYFYGLYSGRSLADYREKAFECTLLDVYTWDGQLSKEYLLDIPVLCICRDNVRGVFYGIANLPDPTLIEFSTE